MNSTCEHFSSDTFSGDLICLKCGQVLQINSQLSLEPAYLDRPGVNQKYQTHTDPLKLSHQERSELALHSLARKLISSFALKSSYESEAIELMQKFWTITECKQKYGLSGNRLLIAAIFLLARRDHLAINLTLLATSIDSTSQECGVFLDPLIKIDPSLRSLSQISDFVERSVDLLLTQLFLHYQMKLIESHLQFLLQQTQKIAYLLKEEERGSSKTAESISLAAAWVSLSGLLLFDTKIKVEAMVHLVCDVSALSFRTVKSKHSILLDKLFERGVELLPSTFSGTALRLTRPRRISLMLKHLNLII